MFKKRTVSKLGLHTETVRSLSGQDMRQAGGAGSLYTKGSCSSQTNEYTCCVAPSQVCTRSSCEGGCESELC